MRTTCWICVCMRMYVCVEDNLRHNIIFDKKKEEFGRLGIPRALSVTNTKTSRAERIKGEGKFKSQSSPASAYFFFLFSVYHFSSYCPKVCVIFDALDNCVSPPHNSAATLIRLLKAHCIHAKGR